MLDVVAVPFCTVVRFERWDAPAGRYFASYSTRSDFVSLAGHAVIDEFASISSPIILGPRALLGKLYDAGISLGHRRDPEMGIDLGWPPLCIGLEMPAPALTGDWQKTLLSALSQPYDIDRPVPPGTEVHRVDLGGWQLAAIRLAEATILATSAPLMPRQLQRLCEAAVSKVVVSVATGNRLQRVESGQMLEFRTISEAELERLQMAMQDLASSSDALGSAGL